MSAERHIYSENEAGRGLSDSAVVGATSEMIDEEEGLPASASSGGAVTPQGSR